MRLGLKKLGKFVQNSGRFTLLRLQNVSYHPDVFLQNASAHNSMSIMRAGVLSGGDEDPPPAVPEEAGVARPATLCSLLG